MGDHGPIHQNGPISFMIFLECLVGSHYGEVELPARGSNPTTCHGRKHGHHIGTTGVWGGTLSTSLRLCASFCRVCELVLHVKLHIHHITYICVLHIYLLDILYTPNTYSDPSRIQTPTLDLVSAIQVTRYQILSPWEMVRV